MKKELTAIEVELLKELAALCAKALEDLENLSMLHDVRFRPENQLPEDFIGLGLANFVIQKVDHYHELLLLARGGKGRLAQVTKHIDSFNDIGSFWSKRYYFGSEITTKVFTEQDRAASRYPEYEKQVFLQFIVERGQPSLCDVISYWLDHTKLNISHAISCINWITKDLPA